VLVAPKSAWRDGTSHLAFDPIELRAQRRFPGPSRLCSLPDSGRVHPHGGAKRVFGPEGAGSREQAFVQPMRRRRLSPGRLT